MSSRDETHIVREFTLPSGETYTFQLPNNPKTCQKYRHEIMESLKVMLRQDLDTTFSKKQIN